MRVGCGHRHGVLPHALDADRLALHRWDPKHVGPLLDALALSAAELRRWMPWAHETPTEKAELAVLVEGRRRFDAGERFSYFMIERDSAELVGAAGVHRLQRGVVGLGYWVRSDRLRRGYATEATRLLTDAAFSGLPDIMQIEIHMDKANVASAGVPPKVGFRLAGETVRERCAPAHTGRGLVWVLDRATWTARSG